MDSTPKSKSYPLVSTVCGVFVGIYFLFPHLFLLPYVLATGHEPPSPKPWSVLFAPTRYLAHRFPAYGALLAKETEWTGIR